jgi:hypothetical protein
VHMLNDRASCDRHMLNDGATCDSNEKGAKADYSIQSSRLRNAKQVCVSGCHAAILTTRDVATGEELLMSYGQHYWVHRLLELLAKRLLRELTRRNTCPGGIPDHDFTDARVFLLGP